MVKKLQQRMLDSALNNLAISAYLTALGEIKDRRAIKPLIGLLQNDDPGTCRQVSKALTQITGQSFGESHENWLQWWKTLVHFIVSKSFVHKNYLIYSCSA